MSADVRELPYTLRPGAPATGVVTEAELMEALQRLARLGLMFEQESHRSTERHEQLCRYFAAVATQVKALQSASASLTTKFLETAAIVERIQQRQAELEAEGDRTRETALGAMRSTMSGQHDIDATVAAIMAHVAIIEKKIDDGAKRKRDRDDMEASLARTAREESERRAEAREKRLQQRVALCTGIIAVMIPIILKAIDLVVQGIVPLWGVAAAIAVAAIVPVVVKLVTLTAASVRPKRLQETEQ